MAEREKLWETAILPYAPAIDTYVSVRMGAESGVLRKLLRRSGGLPGEAPAHGAAHLSPHRLRSGHFHVHRRRIGVNFLTPTNQGDATCSSAPFKSIEAAAGKSVAETLAELGLTPRPEQSVRVGKSGAGAEEVRDLQARVLQPGESVVVVNRVAGG